MLTDTIVNNGTTGAERTSNGSDGVGGRRGRDVARSYVGQRNFLRATRAGVALTGIAGCLDEEGGEDVEVIPEELGDDEYIRESYLGG